MNKNTLFKLAVILAALSIFIWTAAGSAQSPAPPGADRLQKAVDGTLEITWNPATKTPSFLRGHFPASDLDLPDQASATTTAAAFLEKYADIFGITNVAEELQVLEEAEDSLGIAHVTFRQVFQQVEVYSAVVKVHLQSSSGDILSVSSGFVPGISLASVTPQVSISQARLSAARAMPGGKLTAAPRLVVYPGSTGTSGTPAKLAWLVELRDSSLPARNIYVVDAKNGSILDVIDRLYVSRNRSTYDAGHGTSLPGTLRRSEGDPPVGDLDVDNAHDFAGATYDYYWSTYSLDSYDGAGAALISTAHYGSNYLNAFWDGSQMVYGDSFPVKDVAAHELTHAVTEHSANLEYVWQSGAMNESFSDIFGAMVDRDDWLMGEDLPPAVLSGRDAIRDLADPARLGQPDHTSAWVSTCSDNQGVHTNSGIPNKAYYNIATAITKDKAERIFYRTLTIYLQPTSSLEDLRAAALQSAQDLYGGGSAEYTGVDAGFTAVGLDGVWNPPANNCVCPVALTLSSASNQSGLMETAATLYRLRDELMTSSQAGIHYRELYEAYSGEISRLLLLNPSLFTDSAQILQSVTPGLNLLLDGNGDEAVVTQELVDATIAFLKQLAADDQANGSGELARAIEYEIGRIDWDRLVGMTYDAAWKYIQEALTIQKLFIPLLVR